MLQVIQYEKNGICSKLGEFGVYQKHQRNLVCVSQCLKVFTMFGKNIIPKLRNKVLSICFKKLVGKFSFFKNAEISTKEL
jgi:hypothetical protein